MKSKTWTDQETKRVVRTYLTDALEVDAQARTERRSGRPMYAMPPYDPFTSAKDDDSDIILDLLEQAEEALEEGNARSVASIVAALVERFEVPLEQRGLLTLGILEAQVQIYRELLGRVRGERFVVLGEDSPAEAVVGMPPERDVAPPSLASPKLSKLEADFVAWREAKGIAAHTIKQEGSTFRSFIEVAGDRPPRDYRRADVTAFLSTMGKLPTTYGKSPQYRGKTVLEAVAIADGQGAPRLNPKTVKRHLSLLSRLFKFCFDQGHLSMSERMELTKDQETGRKVGPARAERDAWTSGELKQLFASPVWTGCHHYYRSQMGPEVLRDGKFWLPLLALFHGCRLEEFADLYRRDVKQDDGTWFVSLTTESRRLKNSNASRFVPLHQEIMRIGFLDYMNKAAPREDDPLFPELEPRGADRKRGPTITKWFAHYRRDIGVFRAGVAMHAFRHVANTRIRNLATAHRHERDINYLFGHSRGTGEGNVRYDKGPELKALAETLNLLAYPELDFSHLHVASRQQI